MPKCHHRSVIGRERPPTTDERGTKTVIEWCACGSMRMSSRNGKHFERGKWTFPTEWPEANKPLA